MLTLTRIITLTSVTVLRVVKLVCHIVDAVMFILELKKVGQDAHNEYTTVPEF